MLDAAKALGNAEAEPPVPDKLIFDDPIDALANMLFIECLHMLLFALLNTVVAYHMKYLLKLLRALDLLFGFWLKGIAIYYLGVLVQTDRI